MGKQQSSMANGRALTTDSEREYLAGEHGDQRRYEAKSRVKSRIEKQLADDIEFFAEHSPELNEILREVVCDDS